MKLIKNILKWCYVNDAKAHFYILLTISLTQIPTYLYIHNYKLSFMINTAICSLVIILREVFNKSGFSNKDVFNGYIGFAAGSIISFITIITLKLIWQV